MKCPKCDVDLMLSERQGVEIDYCPKCRGIWLDRGELDKMLARQDAFEQDDDDDERYRRSERHHERDDDYRRHPRKKGFWRELLDFG